MSDAASDRQAGDVIEKVKGLLYEGRKIEAIKVYREARKVGLKEAKDDLDRLESELRERTPEKFKAPAGGKGCLLTAACLLGGGTLLVLLLAANLY